jgi:predicted ATPase/DNA-binding SARP family transcriptional activator
MAVARTWHVRLLGAASLDGVGVDGKDLERKAAALLAYVSLEGPTPRTKLAGLLWPDADEKQARTNLRQLLFRLRPFAGLLVAGDVLRLGPRASVDVAVLRDWVSEGEHHRVAQASAAGSCDLLAGLDYDDCADLHEWVLAQRQHVLDLLCDSLEAEAERLEGTAAYRDALPLARRLADLDPVSEAGYRRLMRLHSLTGDRSAALEVYRRCRAALADALGIEPLPLTVELATAIEQGHLPTPVTLPVPIGVFVGRQEELDELADRLADPALRLLTLVGPGGVGKTRLAVEAAARNVERFGDGAHFVSLAPLTSVEQLVPAVADALGFSFYSQQEPGLQLVNYLCDKELLLVLDNFEHLRDGVGFVSEMRERAPQVKMLVTSRERLQLDGEWVYPVAGLGVPDAAPNDRVSIAPAVRLFIERARQAVPGYHLDPPHASAVARICRMVQGMPLAIELAAPWIWALSPDEIADRIEANLDLLATSDQQLPERHRSLGAAFTYSWDLLTDPEQEAFAKLSVFRGGFDREAADAVTGASMATLLSLVSRSLLTRSANGRFELHELLRQFGRERLDGRQRLRGSVERSHGTYYLRLLRDEDSPPISGRRDPFRRVDEELDNVLAAWKWAASAADAEEILSSDAQLKVYFELRGRAHEGVQVFDRAIDCLDDDDPHQRRARGCLLADRGWLYYLLGKYAEAATSAEEALTRLRPIQEHRGLGVALSTLGNAALSTGDYEEARLHFVEALTVANAEGHEGRITRVHGNLALVEHELGHYAEADRQYQAVLRRSLDADDHHAVVKSRLNLGTLRLDTGLLEEARRLFEEGLDLATAIKDEYLRPVFLSNLAAVALKSGDHHEARAICDEALALARACGDESVASSISTHAGRASVALGEHARAQDELEHALVTARSIGRLPKVLYAIVGFAELEAARGALEQAASLLALVVHHPATAPDSRERAEALLPDLLDRLAPNAAARATTWGRMAITGAEELVVRRVGVQDGPLDRRDDVDTESLDGR